MIGGLIFTNGKVPLHAKLGLGRYIERYDDVLKLQVVDNSKVDQVVSVIVDATHTGSLDDGKIFISTIDEIVDIATKKK